MKVIFLDFDGVLNNMSSLYLRTLDHKHSTKTIHSLAAPNPSSVRLMDHLIKISGARIVVSSSWRIGTTVPELMNILYIEFGLKHIYNGHTLTSPVILGKTKETIGNESRGQQIQDWLDQHPEIQEYVIIDDDSDMLPQQKQYFVQTNIEIGFSGRDFDKCLKILKVPNEMYQEQ